MSDTLFTSDEASYVSGLSGQVKIRLVVTKDTLYFLSFGVSPYLVALTVQFGLLGALIGGVIADKQLKKGKTIVDQSTPEKLSSDNPKKYVKLAYSSIDSFKDISSGWRSLGGLQKTIEIKSEKGKYTLFVPKNDFDTVISLFRKNLKGKEVK